MARILATLANHSGNGGENRATGDS